MNTAPLRIGGNVHKLYKSYGIIEGDDGRHYFFLPSYLKNPIGFPLLTLQTKVQFAPRHHPRGMRARNISVTSTTRNVAHGS